MNDLTSSDTILESRDTMYALFTETASFMGQKLGQRNVKNTTTLINFKEKLTVLDMRQSRVCNAMSMLLAGNQVCSIGSLSHNKKNYHHHYYCATGKTCVIYFK